MWVSTRRLEVGGIYQASKQTKPWVYEGMSYAGEIKARYSSGLQILSPRKEVWKPSQSKGETTMTNKLYEITTAFGALKYGTYLATNSQNQWVMEEKGTGAIFTVDKSSVKEVLPYSIAVRFGVGSRVYHYLDSEKKFTKGFYITEGRNNDFQIAEVTEIGTESRMATTEFKPLQKIAGAFNASN